MAAERKIGERTFRYERMSADQGLKMLLRLMKVLGPAKGLIEAIAAEDEASRDALGMVAMVEFIENMDQAAVYDLIIDMASRCDVNDPQQQHWDKALPGVLELNELIQVAMFALQSEFGSFFADGAGSVLRKMPAA